MTKIDIKQMVDDYLFEDDEDMWLIDCPYMEREQVIEFCKETIKRLNK